VNLAAAKVASGWEDLVVAGGVESMSRWPMGSDGGAWVMDPRINQKTGFVPQGVGADLIATLEGWGRADVDAFALRSHQRAAAARAEGRFAAVHRAGAGHRRPAAAGPRTRPSAPTPALEAMAKLEPSFAMMGADGLRRHRAAQVHHGRAHHHVHHAGNSSGIVDGAALMLVGSAGRRRQGRA
jgi:acetyl-CoA C-acetyltransferase